MYYLYTSTSFDLQDDSIYSGQYELFIGDKVSYDAIDLVDHYKKNPMIQDAMKKLETNDLEKCRSCSVK